MKQIFTLITSFCIHGLMHASVYPSELLPPDPQPGYVFKTYEALPAEITVVSGLVRITVTTPASQVEVRDSPRNSASSIVYEYLHRTVGDNAHVAVYWNSDLEGNSWSKNGVTLHSSPESENDEQSFFVAERVLFSTRQPSGKVDIYIKFDGAFPPKGFFTVFRTDYRVY